MYMYIHICIYKYTYVCMYVCMYRERDVDMGVGYSEPGVRTNEEMIKTRKYNKQSCIIFQSPYIFRLCANSHV